MRVYDAGVPMLTALHNGPLRAACILCSYALHLEGSYARLMPERKDLCRDGDKWGGTVGGVRKIAVSVRMYRYVPR